MNEHLRPYDWTEFHREQFEYCRDQARYWREKYLDEKRAGYRGSFHLRHCIKQALSFRDLRREAARQLENEHVQEN